MRREVELGVALRCGGVVAVRGGSNGACEACRGTLGFIVGEAAGCRRDCPCFEDEACSVHLAKIFDRKTNGARAAVRAVLDEPERIELAYGLSTRHRAHLELRRESLNLGAVAA